MKVAILLVLALLSTPAQARSYPCWMIRWYVNNHSRAEVEAQAREHHVTARERREALACLRDKS